MLDRITRQFLGIISNLVAMTTTGQQQAKPGGGSIAIRGFLVQTLAALLDITHGDHAFTELTLETLVGDDQFDFFLEEHPRGLCQAGEVHAELFR